MTRIYSAGTNLSNIDTSIIQEYLSKVKKETCFYTENGIFSIYKGELVKYDITDKDIINYKYDNISVAIDQSIIYKNRGHFQLPYNYVCQKNSIFHYKLCDNSEVKLIITINNDNIIDMYFFTNQDYTHPEVQNTITTFLSLLNFY